MEWTLHVVDVVAVGKAGEGVPLSYRGYLYEGDNGCYWDLEGLFHGFLSHREKKLQVWSQIFRERPRWEEVPAANTAAAAGRSRRGEREIGGPEPKTSGSRGRRPPWQGS